MKDRTLTSLIKEYRRRTDDILKITLKLNDVSTALNSRVMAPLITKRKALRDDLLAIEKEMARRDRNAKRQNSRSAHTGRGRRALEVSSADSGAAPAGRETPVSAGASRQN